MMAVMRGDHRKTREAAFARFGLEDSFQNIFIIIKYRKNSSTFHYYDLIEIKALPTDLYGQQDEK